MDGNIKILVCCHKADTNIRNYSPYYPIQVGKAINSNLDLGFQNDNDGDNISEKNPFWCELTALYWGWKNLKDVKYAGLCHYRRYLDENAYNIEKDLNKYDMIVGDSNHTPHPIAHGLVRATSRDDFYIYLDTIISMHPDAREAAYKFFFDSNAFIPFTMFLTTKNLYDEYCEFIFPILNEVEKKIKKHFYSRQKRCIAYFGEWSLGLFICYKKLNVKRVPVVSGQSYCIHFNERLIVKVSNFFFNLKMDILFKLLYNYNQSIYRKVPDDVLVGFKQDGIILNSI